jgi:hypothetical protein
LKQLGFVLACLIIPIAWGWLVNLLFTHWSRRRGARRHSVRPHSEDDQSFSDYQI